jgi:S-DNA-T family DNA segregation ATPase FtsK/SpoIIIE
MLTRITSSDVAISPGKSASNNYACNLKEMENLFIGGSTGSGKSFLMNSFILSLVTLHTSEELRLILIDPKNLEFSQHEGHPHVCSPVINNVKDTIGLFACLLEEIVSREKDLNQYYQTTVVFIDEYADYMQSDYGFEFVQYLNRLAEKGPSVGVHFIISTQRTYKEVLPQSIKRFFKYRMALKVANATDSEIIIGQSGAENLNQYTQALLNTGKSLIILQRPLVY